MDKQAIADRLKAKRGNKTQQEVADAVGISKSSLSMYENGERIPKDEVKLKLAKYFKTTVQKLFYS